jgi:hypothetical protein
VPSRSLLPPAALPSHRAAAATSKPGACMCSWLLHPPTTWCSPATTNFKPPRRRLQRGRHGLRRSINGIPGCRRAAHQHLRWPWTAPPLRHAPQWRLSVTRLSSHLACWWYQVGEQDVWQSTRHADRSMAALWTRDGWPAGEHLPSCHQPLTLCESRSAKCCGLLVVDQFSQSPLPLQQLDDTIPRLAMSLSVARLFVMLLCNVQCQSGCSHHVAVPTALRCPCSFTQ